MTLSSQSDFPAAIRVGNTVYVAGSTATDVSDNIELQTAQAFERFVASLKQAGTSMADLVNLRTYYVYAGADGREVTEYWERMTAVRLRFFADPGPAATALRVSGVPDTNNLIGFDGIAAIGGDRQRIMPDHSWDWSIPVPLSQGWRIGDKIYVGGQISADRAGSALAVDDVVEQTRITLDYIRHVLLDGGLKWSDVVTMRIGFKHGDDAHAARRLLADIAELVRQAVPEQRPSLTAFGVDLLYEGLVLEIDAVARASGKQSVVPVGSQDWASIEGFPPACLAGNELHIGGLCTPEESTFQVQVERTFGRLADTLSTSGFTPVDLVKLTLFVVLRGNTTDAAAEQQLVMDTLRRSLPDARPVLTLLSVPGLPHEGQRFQLDGIAVREPDRISF